MRNTAWLIGIIAGGLVIVPSVRSQADPATPAAPETTPAEPSEAGHIVIPAIPGVPKIFLPDIGISGDFAFERNNLQKTDPRYTSEQPRIRDGGVVFYSPIDPYTNAQFTIDLPENGPTNIEEAWLYFNKLPGQTSVRLGRFLPKFGLLDTMDTFQLAMLNRPTALANYLSPDGLNGTGVEFNAYVPNPWDWNLKFNVNAVRGDALLLGASSDTTDLTYLTTFDYSRDMFTSGSLQMGVSAAQGPSPVGQSQVLEEPYVQVQYSPTQRRIWTWSVEGMMAQRKGLGDDNNKNGFYTFLDYNFALRYHLGLLADLADQAIEPYGKTFGIGPNATWFLSDNTRLRLQYTHTTPVGGQKPEEKVSLQATFSLGNLKQLD